MADSSSHKERVRAQFGGSAEAYVASPGHAAGDDLAALAAWAALVTAPHHLALDIATGGGHTALALASIVGRVVASDLTPRMLTTAAAFIGGRGMTNVTYTCADAERLPFADRSFDLVTCRIAPHHFGDIPAFVREASRVLRQSGHFLLIDNITPEDPALDAFLHRAETLRDATHHRSLTATRWRELFEAADLIVEDAQIIEKTHPFADWLTRARVPADRQALLDEHFRRAAPIVREAFVITIGRDGEILSYNSRAILLKGRKAN